MQFIQSLSTGRVSQPATGSETKSLRESGERKKGFGACFHTVSCPSLRAQGGYNSELTWLDLPEDSRGQTTNTPPLFLILFVCYMNTCLVYFVCSLTLGHIESLKLGKMVIRAERSHGL